MSGGIYLSGGLALVLYGSFLASSFEVGAPGLGDPDLRTAPVLRSLGRERFGREHRPCDDVRHPERVVSAALLTDELLLDLLPFDRWAAVSYVVDWPASTPVSFRFPRALPRTGGSTEQILNYQPDLVVLSDYNSAAVVARLESTGVCVHRVPAAQTFDALFEAWIALGRLVGETERSKQLVAEARARLERVQRQALDQSLRVLLLQGMFSYGPGSTQDECLHVAGLRNVLTDPGYGATPAVSVERILSLEPDLIFVAADVETPRQASLEMLPLGVPWRALAAVRRERVFAVPASWMASISHHALLACEAYLELARGAP